MGKKIGETAQIQAPAGLVEFEVMEIIADFPLVNYMTPHISELMFNNIVALRIPLMSLN